MSPPASFQTFEESLAHVGGSLCHLASLVLLSSAIWRVQSRISIAIKREQKTTYKRVYVFVCVFPTVYTYFGYHWVKLSRPWKCSSNSDKQLQYWSSHQRWTSLRWLQKNATGQYDNPYEGVFHGHFWPAIMIHYDIMIPREWRCKTV